MDFEGHSIIELSTDPSVLAAIVVLQQEVTALQDEVKTLEQDVITLAYTDQLCFVEAQVTLDPRPGQDSYEVLQPVTLIGVDPPLYFSSGTHRMYA